MQKNTVSQIQEDLSIIEKKKLIKKSKNINKCIRIN